MQHREFSLTERRFIELRLLGNWSLRLIGQHLGRHHTAVSRETGRNRCPDGRYRAEEAHGMAVRRARGKSRGMRLDRDPELAAWVEARLRDGWSPERISGRLRTKPPPYLAGKTISHESIYRWIYGGGGRFGDLHRCLWTRRKRRVSHKGRKPKRCIIKGRVPLEERPTNSLPGHMESDSMVWSSSRGLLSVQACRTFLLTRIRWCKNRTAGETAHALRRTVETLPHRFVRSMAFDNGSEGARHGILTEEYGVPTFFCEPYSPWQKPIVENMNRTIRHWLPRKTKAHDLAAVDWKEIEDRLNGLPRKSLGYLTPNEALNQYLEGGATET